jgi:hypothetical protein
MAKQPQTPKQPQQPNPFADPKGIYSPSNPRKWWLVNLPISNA